MGLSLSAEAEPACSSSFWWWKDPSRSRGPPSLLDSHVVCVSPCQFTCTGTVALPLPIKTLPLHLFTITRLAPPSRPIDFPSLRFRLRTPLLFAHCMVAFYPPRPSGCLHAGGLRVLQTHRSSRGGYLCFLLRSKPLSLAEPRPCPRHRVKGDHENRMDRLHQILFLEDLIEFPSLPAGDVVPCKCRVERVLHLGIGGRPERAVVLDRAKPCESVARVVPVWAPGLPCQLAPR